MRFNRKADQGDKGGDSSRSSSKLWEAVEMAELEVGVPNGLVVPLSGGWQGEGLNLLDTML